MTPLVPLRNFGISPGVGWASIPLTETDDPAWANAVAGKLCEGERTQKKLAERLFRGHRDLLAGEPHQLLAVWVPRPAVPSVEGFLAVDWMLPDEGHRLTRDYYRSLVEPGIRVGVQTYGRILEELELPAGPTLLAQEVIGRGGGILRRQTLQQNSIYTVFPPGCSDALQVTFATMDLSLGDVMATDAVGAMETLRIILEEPE